MEAQQETEIQTKETPIKDVHLFMRAIGIASLLYCFLVGVKVLSSSFNMMGGGFAHGVLSIGANPILGLFSGLLATVLIQSSSATSSIIVGLVSSGSIGLSGAVPMIMGANLGTSVTNTLVSIGYVKDKLNFKRAFAAATVHDFFNILSVAVLLPLEIATGFLESLSRSMATFLFGSATDSVTFSSPVKAAIKPVVQGIQYLIVDVFGLEGAWGGVLMLALAAIIILASLSFIVRITKEVVEGNKGQILEKLLNKNPYLTLLFGALLTFSVQSSSIATSLLVPLAGAGVVSLEAILPVTVGANIGTTTTALLASLAGNVHGLAIALVHLFFNIFGTVIWFIPESTRRLPLFLANTLAEKTSHKKRYGLGYVLVLFFLLPISLIVVFN